MLTPLVSILLWIWLHNYQDATLLRRSINYVKLPRLEKIGLWRSPNYNGTMPFYKLKVVVIIKEIVKADKL